MKNLKLSTWCTLLAMVTFFTGCKDDENDLNLNVTAVETLYTPEDNIFIKLDPSAGFTHVFEWSPAHAEDGSVVLYEIAFDQENGDFTEPFYIITSDGKGLQTKATLTHSDLNKIAKLGGADFFEKKKFKWTVWSAKGSNIKRSAESRVIELERPEGVDPMPGEMYLTGSATEGGTAVSDALKMNQIQPGVFEIHTKLASGTYKLVDGLGNDARVFYIKEGDGIKKIGADGETTYSGSDKVFRITADFNSLGAKVHEVKSVGFWYAVTNSVKYNLDYIGEGVWKTTVSPFNLEPAPWGGFEERHKYKVVLNDGSNDITEWWGYQGQDSPGKDGTYGSTDPSYFYAYPGPENNQWDWTWKLDRNAVNGKTIDFLMKFPGDQPYASEYIIHP